MATRTLKEAEAALQQGGLQGNTLNMALSSLRNSYAQTDSSAKQPPTSGAIRDLQAQGGDSAAQLGATRTQSQQTGAAVPQGDAYSNFNGQLTQMLQRYQSLGTKRFAEQGLNAQQAQNDRISAPTPSNLIGADPSTQNSVRSNYAGALDPTIQQAGNAQQTFGEQIKSLGTSLDTARNLVKDYQAQDDKKRDDARAVIKDALTMGGAGSLNGLAPDELKQLEKMAGYPSGYISGLTQTIKEREDQLKADHAAELLALKQGSTPSITYDENGNVIQTGNYDALTIGRYNRAANAATTALRNNQTYKNIISSSAYLDRIEAAIQNPGSIGDQELLDAFTQLNTGGNRVTEAQVHLITKNQSLGDFINKSANKLSSGGALSTAQRNEIVSLAHEVYKNYQGSYSPLYNEAAARLQSQGIPQQFWNIPSPQTLSRAVGNGGGSNNASGGGSANDPLGVR